MTRRELDFEIAMVRARLRARPRSRPLRLKLAALLVRRGRRREALSLYGALATEFQTDGDLTNAFTAYQAMLGIDPTGRAARWGRKQAIRQASRALRARSDEPSVDQAEQLLRETGQPSAYVADEVFSALAHDNGVPPARLRGLASRMAGTGLVEAMAAALVDAGRPADASVVFQALAAAYAESGDDAGHRAALEGLRATDQSDLGSRRRIEP